MIQGSPTNSEIAISIMVAAAVACPKIRALEEHIHDVFCGNLSRYSRSTSSHNDDKDHKF